MVGFEASGLDECVVGDFVAAIDDLLTRYPVLVLHRVVIAELPGDKVVLAQQAAPDHPGGTESAPVELILSAAAAKDPDVADALGSAMTSWAQAVATTAARPVYTATVGELGRVLDFAGGGAAQTGAQRALIAAYLDSVDADQRRATLGRLVRGYKQWRSRLGERSVDRGQFDPDAAIVDAFTDVVINGGRASDPARVLYRLLVTSAPDERGEMVSPSGQPR
ncbi:hypothetical protein ABZV91_19390 [Nocardia sp. NPDC004568]|uniref:hypothetical protein n=1 Tax=Nocardia sp. NPDC004568 TaxID=3154551 RepID=UPI0033A803EF